MKKLLSIILSLMLVLSLIPLYGPQAEVSANTAGGGFFSFPNESRQKQSARIVSDDTVTLNGTISNIIGSSVSYRIKQVTMDPNPSNDNDVIAQTQEITQGISITNNRITITNIVLFPGMNKIEFTGSRGASMEYDYIYVEYRDSPMITELEYTYNNNGTKYKPVEGEALLIPRPANPPYADDSLLITGKAPNASLVVLNFNGAEVQQAVTNTNEYRFYFTNMDLDLGVNTIKFTITTASQELVVTKEIILYNNNPVFFDEQLTLHEAGNVSKTEPLLSSGQYIVNSNVESIDYSATMIVPKPFPITPTTMATTTAQIETYIEANLRMSINGTSTPATINNHTTDIIEKTDYYEVKVNVPLYANRSAIDTFFNSATLNGALSLGIIYQMVGGSNFTKNLNALLIDGRKMYIADVNVFSSYNTTLVNHGVVNSTAVSRLKSDTSANSFYSLESTDILPNIGANVYSVPFLVEVLVGQAEATLTPAQLSAALQITSGATTLSKRVLTDSTGTNLLKQTVVRTVEGQQQSYTRFFVEISNLQTAGSNNLTFKFVSPTSFPSLNVNLDAKTYRFNMMSGPYVRFDNISNGRTIEYSSNTSTEEAILRALNYFQGEIFNLPNTDEIVYSSTATSSKRQTVFLYLNNVEVPLQPASVTDLKKFEPKGLITTVTPSTVPGEPDVVTYSYAPLNSQVAGADKSLAEAASAINRGGNNVIKFTVYSKSYNFTSTYTVSIMPKDLPKVPADNSEGVFPYESSIQWPPIFNSNDYQPTGTSYTTRKGSANVLGTFNLIDIHSRLTTSATPINVGAIDSIIDSLGTDTQKLYQVVISSPEWGDEVYRWDLSKELYIVDDDMNLYTQSGTGTVNVGAEFDSASPINAGETVNSPTGSVRMFYNAESNYFYFNILQQRLPQDNSPLVFVVSVYNAGEGGPRASYRVEINPISIPYTIHSPIPENRITNSNFVEVIISAPGAESMVIDKQTAQKIQYISYESSSQQTYIDSFRVVVKNLKANKDTTIPFTITRAGITTNGSIDVKYVPTNIPGAQYLETMKSSHKLFEGALTLSFPKNTNLIRSSFVEANDNSTQVYNGHDIMFSIANSIDGIVNRHLFETMMANYQVESTRDGRNILTDQFLDYAGRYIKASQVFWIDAGLADNPATTTSYDPITTGLDPFPFPNRPGLSTLGVSNRRVMSNREIIPSKSGTLTLQYDPSIVSSASATVTVFHYDPVLQRWDNIGGVVDSKKGTVAVPFNKFGYYVVAKLTRGYNDITFHSYARDAMEAIYAKGVMNAVNNAVQFGGDQYVTRGEFAKMIVKALQLPLNYSGTLHFSYYPETISNVNVPQSLYDYRHIETAARAGIVNGTSPGFFDEVGQLTRQDAAVILARALELKLETDSTKAKQQIAKAFQDSGNMNLYAVPSILAMQKKGFIKGELINQNDPKSGYVYQPLARMLRSDAAIIMARVMIDQKKLSPIFF